jgi:hypothetical protein
MATVTPNFNWPVPTSTDLVKDGAVAIEALGDSIDASLVDLKGGTSGQVLAKASNTDMDFAWVAQDDSNAIQNSIVNAKGDLIGASANDTPAILSVGANGETLVADSSTSTGLRYQVPVNVNPVLNSSFQVWQRGTTGTANGVSAYNADRWTSFQNAGSITSSRQATGDTTNLPMIQYCNRVQRNSGSTVTNTYFLSQPFETINSVAYAGKTVTLSFYARAGANFSAASSLLYAQLNTGTGTDQNNIAGFTGAATPINSAATLTTTWQRFSYTGTLATNITQLAMVFYYTPTGTAGASDYYEITGVQLEVGSVATPFRTYAGTIQGELAACLRYYWRSEAGSINQKFTQGPAFASTNALCNPITMPSPMRIKPTALDYGGTIWFQQHAGVGGFTFTALSVDADYSNTKQVVLNISGVSGMTAGTIYELKANSSASAYIGISAEL